MTDRTMPDNDDPIARSTTDMGNLTDVGFSNPGSPTDHQDVTPLPDSGGVGADDPGSGSALEGEDQGHDREIAGVEHPADAPMLADADDASNQ